jgi:hypothetical protein
MSSRDPFHMVLTSTAALIALALAGCGITSASAPDPQRTVVTATKATPPPVGTKDAVCQHIAGVSNLTVTRTDSPQNQPASTFQYGSRRPTRRPPANVVREA